LRDEPEVAVARLEESVFLGRQTGRSPFLSLALTFLGRSLLRVNGPFDGRARAALLESLWLAEGAPSRYAMGHALVTLGDLNWQRGDTERAVARWQGALVVRSDITDRRGIADSLERLGWGLALYGKAESAAWLLGAADAQYTRLGTELRPDERLDHAEQVSATRARLPAEVFNRAWSAGQAATVKQAVATALAMTGWNPEPETGGDRLAAEPRTLARLRSAVAAA
jgi:non-specific serine/threonine protein kinase